MALDLSADGSDLMQLAQGETQHRILAAGRPGQNCIGRKRANDCPQQEHRKNPDFLTHSTSILPGSNYPYNRNIAHAPLLK